MDPLNVHQLQQVFVNIIGNARQAIEPVRREGKIVIRTRYSGELLTIEFEDIGAGIRPENLARIFDLFFTTKPVGKGTGLGLSLCYGIIQEHGGRITARRELGVGAVFAIELPVARDVPLTMAPAVRSNRSVSPFGYEKVPASGRSVLVIDDEEWILDLASELLRAGGAHGGNGSGWPESARDPQSAPVRRDRLGLENARTERRASLRTPRGDGSGRHPAGVVYDRGCGRRNISGIHAHA